MLLLTLLTALLFGSDNGKKSTLLLEIKGIREVKGDVQVGIYNNAEGFSLKETVYVAKVVTVKGTTVLVEIPELPHGTYAVAAYHDKNRNGKLDKSLLGIPTEVYGFSNNARGTFGPPDFSDAKFVFNGTVNKVSLELK